MHSFRCWSLEMLHGHQKQCLLYWSYEALSLLDCVFVSVHWLIVVCKDGCCACRVLQKCFACEVWACNKRGCGSGVTCAIKRCWASFSEISSFTAPSVVWCVWGKWNVPVSLFSTATTLPGVEQAASNGVALCDSATVVCVGLEEKKWRASFVLGGSVDMWVCGDMGNGWTGWVIFARGWCVFSEFRSFYMSFGGKRVTAWAASCTVPLQYSSRVISAWSLKQCLLQKRKKRKLIHERERERERSVWVDKERAEYVWECLQYVLKRKADFYRNLFGTSTVKERKKEKYIYIYIYKYINKEYMQSEQRKKERKKVYSLHNRHTQRKKTKERYALCRISDGGNT